MAIDEFGRHQLHSRLEEVLGSQEAAHLMAMVPTAPWEEIVTKDYLDLRLEGLRNELVATFRGEFSAQTRTIVLSLVGTVVAFAAVVLTAMQLVVGL